LPQASTDAYEVEPFEEKVSIPWEEGTLEGELVYDPGGGACDGALLLSPHPNLAGTMENNVIKSLASHLGKAGYAALRFNYPGVGMSTIDLPDNMSGFDFWDMVEREQRFDKAVDPSKAALRFFEESLGGFLKNIHLVGYSFGGIVSLLTAMAIQEIRSVTAISLPWILRNDYRFIETIRCPKFFITGDRDFAFEKNAFDLVWPRIPEPKYFLSMQSDHFFRKRETELAERVLGCLHMEQKVP